MNEEKYIKSLMDKYENMVLSYAKKINSAHVVGMGREDIEQELRIVLYNSIITYSISFQQWKDGERNKPSPLEFYIRSSFRNLNTKIFQNISKEKNINGVTFDVAPYDYGEEDKDPFQKKEMLKELGINLYEGLKGRQMLAFMEYLKEGVDDSSDFIRYLSKKWKIPFNNLKELIKKQKKLIADKLISINH